MGLCATSKNKLVKDILWRKRLPLSITIPVVSGLSLICIWTTYLFEMNSDKKYYPPFHAKRVFNYCKDFKRWLENGN
jgi:hypothetical protein